jgi:hypothetical protein
MMQGDTVKYQTGKEPIAGSQVLYLGRFVDKDTFTAFVYNIAGEKTLAKNYNEYTALVSSGAWYSTPDDAAKGIHTVDVSVLDAEEEKTQAALTKIKAIKSKAKNAKNGGT